MSRGWGVFLRPFFQKICARAWQTGEGNARQIFLEILPSIPPSPCFHVVGLPPRAAGQLPPTGRALP